MSIRKYYYDTNGTIHAAGHPSFKADPTPITFRLKDTRCVNLFIANNPWRALDGNNGFTAATPFFQYCVFCKEDKFKNEECFVEKMKDTATNLSKKTLSAIFSLEKPYQIQLIMKNNSNQL